jgi:hypothetical protein
MTNRLHIAVASMILLLGVSVDGQMRRQGPMAEYDPARETTVKGTFVRSYLGPLGDLAIVEITAGGKPLHLFLGPPNEIDKLKVAFTKGAAIEAVAMPGFKVNGEPALLARQITSGKQKVTLRDASGKPVWGGS